MKNQFTFLAACCTAGFVATFACTALAREPSPADIDFFEKQVRPILSQKCQKCHSASKQEGGLRLDTRDGLIKGGDSGAAIVPHKPSESLLIEAIGYGGDTRMPPVGKLADAQIAALTEWVERGAPWPADREAAAKAAPFNLAERKAKQWVFQPVKSRPLPAVKQPD